MYQWLLFVHMATVLAFMLGHGVHVAAMWRQRRETDPAANLALFSAIPDLRVLRVLGIAVLLSGFALVALLGIWDRAWVWASLAILAVVWAVMFRFGGAWYQLLSDAGDAAIAAAGTDGEAAALEAFAAARGASHPILMTVVGLGGLAATLWLMIFKPA